ncbi:MAG: peptidoglycan DD-metalloendopeptidase family protein [Oscillospiraceae bacterium]|nr:peptidoglycan DD-metalloendopeptidase family protein [Oscillospiraceae bacterium]
MGISKTPDETRNSKDKFMSALASVVAPFFIFGRGLKKFVYRSRNRARLKGAPAALLYGDSDKKIGFWTLYFGFRAGKLGLIDSAYNSLYLIASVAAERTERVPMKEYDNVMDHPHGWFSDSSKMCGETRYDRYLAWLDALARFKGRLPFIRRYRIHKDGTMYCRRFGSFIKNNAAYITPAISAAVLVFIISSELPIKPAIVVSIGDERVGFIQSKSEFDSLVKDTEKSASDVLGYSFKLPEKITYTVELSNSNKYVSKEEQTYSLNKHTSAYITSGYGMYIDGVLVAVSESREVFDSAIASALNHEQQENLDADISLLNNISFSHDTYPVESFMTKSQISSLLMYGSEKSVKSAKSESVVIDSVAGAMVRECAAVSSENAYFLSEASAEGQSPLDSSSEALSDETAALHYSVTSVEKYAVTVDYTTEYIDDNTIFIGKQYTKQDGVSGINMITATVTRVDGDETERTIESTETLVEMVPEIIVRGTRIHPEERTDTGNKIFMVPLDLFYVTSYYGMRDLDGDGYKEDYHTGVDLRAEIATDVYAAMSGEVIFTGYMGSYGDLIKIQHPNGMYTYYAHLSSYKVKVGDTVKQGDLIALSGDSGNTQAPHLHFEIRNSDLETLNPLKYLLTE